MPEATGESVIGIVESDGQISVTVFARVGGGLAEPIGEGRVTLLIYDETLAALGLQPGRVEVVASGRALPRRATVFTGNLAAGAFSGWTRNEELPRLVSQLSIPEPAESECAERGGCYRDQIRDLRGMATCSFECAEPTAFDVAPPEAIRADPEAPHVLPCSGDWEAQEIAVVGGTRTICRPPVVSCAVGEYAIPASGCLRVGTACPNSGEWAAVGNGPVIFVRAGATGGDGTRAAPVGTATAALALAQDGDTIAFTAGVFPMPLVPTRNVRLLGACTETMLQGGWQITDPTQVSFANLTLEAGTTALGLLTGTRVTLDDVVLRAGTFGVVDYGGDLLLRRVRLESGITGIVAEYGRVEIEDTSIEQPDSRGQGIYVRSATITARRLSIRSVGNGMLLDDPRGVATLTDVDIRGPTAAEVPVTGIYASHSPAISAERIAIGPNLNAGLALGFCFEACPSTAPGKRRFVDLVLEPASRGATINAESTFPVEIERAAVLDVERYGVHAYGLDLHLRDVQIFGGATGNSNDILCGLGAANVNLDAERVSIDGTHGRGGLCITEGTARMSDLAISDTKASGDIGGGWGVITTSAAATLTRLKIARVERESLSFRGDSVITVEDVHIDADDPNSKLERNEVSLIGSSRLVGRRIDVYTSAATAFRVADASTASVSDMRVSSDQGRVVAIINEANARLERVAAACREAAEGFYIESEGHVLASDIEIAGCEQQGIGCSHAASLSMSNVTLSSASKGIDLEDCPGTWRNVALTGTRSSRSDGLRIREAVEIQFSNFSIRSYGGAGLNGTPGGTTFDRGHIEDNVLGVYLTDRPLRESTFDVSLLDNERALESQ